MVTVLSMVTALPKHLGSKVNIPFQRVLASYEAYKNPLKSLGWVVMVVYKPILVISPRPRPKSRLINGKKIHHCQITAEEVCRV